jgi:hypothetical protein
LLPALRQFGEKPDHRKRIVFRSDLEVAISHWPSAFILYRSAFILSSSPGSWGGVVAINTAARSNRSSR